MSFGIYESTFTEEDKDFLKDSKLGQIDGEIQLLRVRLFRLSKVARDIDSGKLTIDKAPVMEQVEENSAGTGGGEGAGTWDKNLTRSHRRLPDVDGLIDRYATRVASLEKIRAELLGTINSGEGTIIVIKGGLPKDDEDEPDGG